MNYIPSTLESHYGRLQTDRSSYLPLEQVTVSVTGRASGDDQAYLRVCDPLQRTYHELDIALIDNRGKAIFTASGVSGTHYIYLFFPGEKRWSRYLNFEVQPETGVWSGDPDFDTLFPFTRERMRLGRREYHTPRGKFVGYISADTWHFDGIWLRDWIYGMPAYRHWERDLMCGIDRFLEMQSEAGMLPDGIERDGRTWRVGLESDVEYILTLAVWGAWQACGDDAWLRSVLPRLEHAMAYIRSDPLHWDAHNQLIKRQHSCDTWDFDIDGATDHGDRRHVIATCDQSGYYLAFVGMSRMYAALGETKKSKEWAEYAHAYRQRAVDLLWDGGKFQHHVHLDPIDHADFDETHQLAMGNTWAVTRGLASPDQARRVVDEYQRRLASTGDAYPWWSLQPGYPDHLGYFKEDHRQQGGYANGGLMPWVGGELCRGAFACGRETLAVGLLRQYADHLRHTGGAQVWYWPDGTPGFRTTNEVNYAGWGMAQWTAALMEGLAGIEDAAGLLREVRLSPRWAAAGILQTRASASYAASGACFAYQYTWKQKERQLNIEFTGSGEKIRLHVLLPDNMQPQQVLLNGAPLNFETWQEDQSRYLDCSAPIQGVSQILVSSL